MKKLPFLIIVPLIAVLVLVGAAMTIRVSNSSIPTSSDTTGKTYPQGGTGESGSAPSTFLGGLFGQKATTNTPSPTPQSSEELSRELKSSYDDGAQAELDSLVSDAASL